MGQSSHPHREDDMAHNYAHGPSMFDHFILPTTILRKVRRSKHVKSHDLQSHPMWWVLFIANKHNPLAQTYKLKIDNLFHELWHTKEYFGAKQLLDFP
jgi:hypothetical protein